MISLGFTAIYVVVKRREAGRWCQSGGWDGWGCGVCWILSRSDPTIREEELHSLWFKSSSLEKYPHSALTFNGVCKSFTQGWGGKIPWNKLCYVSIKDPAFTLWFASVKKDKPHISQSSLIPNSIYVCKRFPWQYVRLKEESFRKKHISNVIPHLGLCLKYIHFILTFCPGSSGKFFFFSIKKTLFLSLKATKPAELLFFSPRFIQLWAPRFYLIPFFS